MEKDCQLWNVPCGNTDDNYRDRGASIRSGIHVCRPYFNKKSRPFRIGYFCTPGGT